MEAEKTQRKQKPTPEEVERVMQLRREGRTYAEIDAAMGWPEAKGAKSWRICNDPAAYKPRGRYQPRRVLAHDPRVAEIAATGAPPAEDWLTPRQDRRSATFYGRRAGDELFGHLVEAVAVVLQRRLGDQLGTLLAGVLAVPRPAEATPEAPAPAPRKGTRRR